MDYNQNYYMYCFKYKNVRLFNLDNNIGFIFSTWKYTEITKTYL